MKLTALGHSCVLIEIDTTRILIDPYIDGNTLFPSHYRDACFEVDYVLLTHGHHDHAGNILDYNGSSTTIVAIAEIAQWLRTKGVFTVLSMNIGGRVVIENSIEIIMVPALHSSSIVDEGVIVYAGLACGFVIKHENQVMYHFGDTDVFSDMQVIEALHQPNIGLIPVGGRYTMDVDSAAYACNQYFNFHTIIPLHFDTFPPLSADLDRFRTLVNSGRVVELRGGDSLTLPAVY